MSITDNRLFPPFIEGGLPAFVLEGEEPQIVVNYTLNRGVNYGAIGGYQLQVKKVTTNRTVATLTGDTSAGEGVAVFSAKEIKAQLVEGQYYKFQLAFVDKRSVVGYFSTPGIARYISAPAAEILSFDPEEMRVTARYTPKDSGEFLHSYSLSLYKATNELVETTGEITFNSGSVDSDNAATIVYGFKAGPSYGQSYYVAFRFTTGNAYSATGRSESVQALPSIFPTELFQLTAEASRSNGYIQVSLKPEERGGEGVSGSFKLVRASSKDGFMTNEDILDFELIDETPSKVLYKDYFIEQGVEYRYGYRQYNQAYKNGGSNGLISKCLWSNTVAAMMDDMFLVDGKRQLKVRFNPKVSSLKTTLQEAKVDTLGGRYPFIFRNGDTKYREFPISGLVSYLMDDEQLFLKRPVVFNETTSLSDENVWFEREFREAVENWLNNGQVKYFKSPTEGNMLVRLINVSFSPNDTVGRMLYTFNATAYEVADSTQENLKNFGVLDPDLLIPSSNLVAVKQQEIAAESSYTFENVMGLELIVNKDSKRYLTIKKSEQYSTDSSDSTTIKINGQEIIIPGYVQTYLVDLEFDKVVIENKDATDSVTVIYKQRNDHDAFLATSGFEKIKQISVSENGGLRINTIFNAGPGYVDVLETLTKPNEEVSFFSFLDCYTNPTTDLSIVKKPPEYHKLIVNGETIDLDYIKSYSLSNVDYIRTLEIGTEVVLQCGYYLNTIEKVKGE